MKKILFAALTLFSILTISCSKSENAVLIRFKNTLGQDISNARFDIDSDHFTTIGLLKAGETSDYIIFDYFQKGDGLPMGTLSGQLTDSEFWASSGLWCGTGVNFEVLESGKYTIIISEVGPVKGGNYRISFAD